MRPAMTSSGTSMPKICTAYGGGGECIKKQVLQKAPLASKCITTMLLGFCLPDLPTDPALAEAVEMLREGRGSVIFPFTFVTKNYRVGVHLCNVGPWSFIAQTLSYHGQNGHRR